MSTTTLDTRTRIGLGLAMLRVVVGTVFVAHGAQKLFVFGFAGVAEAFAGIGVPFAAVAGPAVALAEFLGGLALIVGYFTRVVGIALAGVMLGAMLFVHLPAGFFLPNGIEFVLTLLAASAALAVTGPGAFSLDARINGQRTV